MSANLSQFPAWLQSLILALVALSILLRHIAIVRKLLQTPTMHSVLSTIRCVAKAIVRWYQDLMTDLYPYHKVFPRINRFFSYGSVVHGYTMSGILFRYFLGVAILWGANRKNAQMRLCLISRITLTLLVGLTGTVHALELPTFKTPKLLPLAVSRELVFAPTDASGSPLSTSSVAMAIANAFPAASKFPPFDQQVTDHKYSAIGGNGVTRGPVSETGGKGVMAAATSDQVQIEYRVQVNNSSGSGVSSTTTILKVAPIAGQPGRFSVRTESLAQRLGFSPGLGFIALGPIAPLEEVANDVESAIAKMQPRIFLHYKQNDEFESTYPQTAVFASFVRQLGNPIGNATTQSPDIREGKFALPGKNPNLFALIRIYPYRDRSKISTSFSIPYEIAEGDSTTFRMEDVKRVSESLRKIAAD